KKRIERRHPGGGPSVGVERGGKAVAGSERTSDTASLPTKLPMILAGVELVTHEENDNQQADDKCDRNHPEDANGRSRVRGAFEARIGRGHCGWQTDTAARATRRDLTAQCLLAGFRVRGRRRREGARRD